MDFIAYDGPGNIVFLTNKEIVGIRGGKVLWKKELNGKIIGGIEKIPNSTSIKDYFKVTTTNQVHVLNLNGTYITNFLLKNNQSDYSGTGLFIDGIIKIILQPPLFLINYLYTIIRVHYIKT